MSTSTAAAATVAFKQKDKQASKLLHLIKIIRDTNTKESEGRKGKNINRFDLETENRVEGDDGFSVIRLYSGLAILVSLIICDCDCELMLLDSYSFFTDNC